MQLALEEFHAFSQGNDIKAELKNGWCAGITAAIGGVIPNMQEGGYAQPEDWLVAAYGCARKALLSLAAQGKDSRQLADVEGLQHFLAQAKDSTDICDQIHTAAFNARVCRVAMSVADWVPASVSGPVTYMLALGDAVFKTKWSIWRANHVGLLVRGGTKLLLFDPNYGLGRFRICDERPLTLAEVTKAIATLAWKKGYSASFGNCTVAIAVLDEDPFALRFSHAQMAQVDALSDAGRLFQK
ncbi:hypothetical protein [Massilia genomosp. 1]|uniref:Peptidase C58 YopT-type domain-containing protein n=1 Tax=Massilia genomosp. 1 TaxID=2609280 RepID=A0ABX0MW73_9BURK|nr:hypothetical protein [Massilia genomosp. 1]NHZ67007.1 hypothetical protein [Massilia genomosp. 1]